MANSKWTVKTELTEEIQLEAMGSPFWIKLKKGLNVGEQKKIYASGFRSVNEGIRELNVNLDHAIFMKVAVYLGDWSLENDEGNKLRMDLEGVKALHPEVFSVIEDVVDAHHERVTQEKKVPPTKSTPEPTSTS